MRWNPGAGLEGKGVVITGAGGAIGAALSTSFASAGARVMAVDRYEDALAATVDSLPGGPHIGELADLADIKSHDALLSRAEAGLGGLDVLVHAAAVIIRREDVDDVTEEDWDQQHDVNLKAAFFLARSAAQAFRRRRHGGRIVLFSSQAWWSGGFAGSVVYAASKGGVVAMSRGLARIYAREGITVNTVAPGAVDTSMLREGATEEQLAVQANQIPMGYLAQPADMCGATLFLASDHARYVTGATINVSGGWLMY